MYSLWNTTIENTFISMFLIQNQSEHGCLYCYQNTFISLNMASRMSIKKRRRKKSTKKLVLIRNNDTHYVSKNSLLMASPYNIQMDKTFWTLSTFTINGDTHGLINTA